MSYSYGKNLRVTLYGQSHAAAIGAVLEGIPAGEPIDMDEVQAFMARRAPGGKLATSRKEPDRPEILSGIVDGVTCGAPISAEIKNTNTRSGDYSNLKDRPRPGHADYTARVKFGESFDLRGGGQFSARLTAPLCFAGAVALQLLKKRGIRVGAHLLQVHGVMDTPYDPVDPSQQLQVAAGKSFPVLDDTAGAAMIAEIEKARAGLDSVGGIVECAVTGLPVGLGDALFGGLECRMAPMLWSIPAVKGLEFGAGFGAAQLFGSQNNDPYFFDPNGSVKTTTNNHGGVLGGITSGMPLIFRMAFKPTPSIAKEQQTVNLATGQNDTLQIVGRHDPCVALRAVPCVEAAAALALLDVLMDKKI